MTIDPIDNIQPVLQTTVNPQVKDDKQPLPTDEALAKTKDVSKQQEFIAKLKALDEVRPEVVQQGKALAQDAAFPNARELDQLAQALLSPMLTSK